MKKLTRTLALLLTLCTLFSCLSIFVSADSLISDGVTAKNPTVETIPNVHDEAVEPYAFVGYCITCDGMVTTACMGEDIYWGTDTHKPLFSEECTVNYYASREYEYCYVCDKFFDEFPPKLCWEMHLNCSRGSVYPVCTANYGPEVFDDWMYQ